MSPRSAAVALLRAYKRWLSPLLPAACRFYPSCSEYASEAIENHGLAQGSWMALRRIARCQPFCRGGFDPVPSTSKIHSPQGTSTG